MGKQIKTYGQYRLISNITYFHGNYDNINGKLQAHYMIVVNYILPKSVDSVITNYLYFLPVLKTEVNIYGRTGIQLSRLYRNISQTVCRI